MQNFYFSLKCKLKKMFEPDKENWYKAIVRVTNK